jgi:hypothetical protein
MSGEIIDATLMPAPGQRNNQARKQAIKQGTTACKIWPDELAKAVHKNMQEQRATLKAQVRQGMANTRRQGAGRDRDPKLWPQEQHFDQPPVQGQPQGKGQRWDLLSWEYALGRGDKRQNGLRSQGRHRLRSQANEGWLRRNDKVSRSRRKKPKGKPMPERRAKANPAQSKVQARAEHVFAYPRDKTGLFIRTIGIDLRASPSGWRALPLTSSASPWLGGRGVPA